MRTPTPLRFGACALTAALLLLNLPASAEAPAKKAAAPEFPNAPAVKPCDVTLQEMSCVPGGPFTRGHNRNRRDARPASRVWVQTFYMDKYEVTNADYKACMKAGACKKDGPSYYGYSDPKQPITGVTWFNAQKFCQWRGKDLPTEAQWEKAARGPDGELHSWGNQRATCKRAVIKDRRGRSCGVPKRGKKPYKGRVLDVGSRPAGRYGLYDMMGNAQEWTRDWYTKSWKKCGKACAGIDPKGPCDGKVPCKGFRFKTIRGGSWYWPASHATGVFRRKNPPSNRPYHHFGWRCGATAEQAQAIAAKRAK